MSNPLSGLIASDPTELEFDIALLQRIGAPVTTANLIALHAWRVAEGSNAKFNYLDTTQAAAGATDYNSVHVRNYPDLKTGVEATAQTLENGYYADILAAFHRGKDPFDVARAQHGLSIWGSYGVDNVLAQWRSRIDALGAKVLGHNAGNVKVPILDSLPGHQVADAAGHAAASGAGAVVSGAESVASFLAKLGDAGTWVRVAYVVGGMALVIVGAFLLEHELITSAVPGAAAGAGAGKAIEAAAVVA